MHNIKCRFPTELSKEGLTLLVVIPSGQMKRYYSYEHNNPSSALNDGEFEREVFISFKGSKFSPFKRDVVDCSVSKGKVFEVIKVRNFSMKPPMQLRKIYVVPQLIWWVINVLS